MHTTNSIPIRIKTPDGVTNEQYLKILKQVALDSDMTLGELTAAALMYVKAVADKVVSAQGEALSKVDK